MQTGFSLLSSGSAAQLASDPCSWTTHPTPHAQLRLKLRTPRGVTPPGCPHGPLLPPAPRQSSSSPLRPPAQPSWGPSEKASGAAPGVWSRLPLFPGARVRAVIFRKVSLGGEGSPLWISSGFRVTSLSHAVAFPFLNEDLTVVIQGAISGATSIPLGITDYTLIYSFLKYLLKIY